MNVNIKSCRDKDWVMTLTTLVQTLEYIPFKLESTRVKRWMHAHGESRRLDTTLDELIGLVQPAARPKSIFKVCKVTQVSSDSVAIDGIEFKGSLLLVNLKAGLEVYPFVATCGLEVEEIKFDKHDYLKKYVLDILKMDLLISAVNYTKERIIRTHKLEQLSTMNPGELDSWPLSQQKPLFSLLGDVEAGIGVRLNQNLGMIPLKSRSGIFFPSESKFENCQFCTRQRCVGRRAAFDPALAEKYKDRAKGICG